MMSYQPKGEAKPMVGKPPAGRYVVTIKEMDTSAAMSGNCNTTSFRFEVVEGDYKGKSIWCRVNHDHKSSKDTNDFAEAKFDALCYALKMPNGWTDKKAIFDKPILLDVYKKKFNETERYEIGTFEQVSNAPIAPLPKAMPAQQAAAPQPQQAVNPNINTNNGQQAPLQWQPPGR